MAEISNQIKKPRKKRYCWSENDEVKLIAIWEENIINLRRAKRNSHVYAEMAKNMQEQKVNVCASEVHFKIANLTARYRTEKKKVGVSGGSPSSWKFFKHIHKIIGAFKCNNLELMEETIDCNDSPTNSVSLEINYIEDISEYLDQDNENIQPTNVDCYGSSFQIDSQSASSSYSINGSASSTLSSRSNVAEEPEKKIRKKTKSNYEVQQNLLKEISRANNNAENLASEFRKESEKFNKYVEESLKIEKRQLTATERLLDIFETSLMK